MSVFFLLCTSYTTCFGPYCWLSSGGLIILGEEYKSLSSSLCSVLQSPVNSSLCDPNILLSAPKEGNVFSAHTIGRLVRIPLKSWMSAFLVFVLRVYVANYLPKGSYSQPWNIIILEGLVLALLSPKCHFFLLDYTEGLELTFPIKLRVFNDSCQLLHPGSVYTPILHACIHSCCFPYTQIFPQKKCINVNPWRNNSMRVIKQEAIKPYGEIVVQFCTLLNYVL
jgi:hypothetical protein